MFTSLQVSHVMCQTSRVTCHMACVKCTFFILYIFFWDQEVELVRGGSVNNGASTSSFVLALALVIVFSQYWQRAIFVCNLFRLEASIARQSFFAGNKFGVRWTLRVQRLNFATLVSTHHFS